MLPARFLYNAGHMSVGRLALNSTGAESSFSAVAVSSGDVQYEMLNLCAEAATEEASSLLRIEQVKSESHRFMARDI